MKISREQVPYFFIIPSISTGVFFDQIFKWISPFSDSMVLDIVYLSMAFATGFLLRRYLFGRSPEVLKLTFKLQWVLIAFFGQVLLYRFIGLYNWGWVLIYLYALLTGVFFGEFLGTKKVYFPFLALLTGFFIGYLIDSYRVSIFLILLSVLMMTFLDTRKVSVRIGFSSFLLIAFYFSIDSDTNLFARQQKYSDRVIYSDYTRINKLDITTWRGKYWYYINNKNRLSSLDSYLYNEPLVHPVMSITPGARNVLIIGGELGGALHELVKYSDVENIHLLPTDFYMIQKIKDNTFFYEIAGKSWEDKRLTIFDENVFEFLNKTSTRYDVIIADLPDPDNLEDNQYYTKEFFSLCHQALDSTGNFVTQAGSPYFATRAFYSIIKTMDFSGFHSIPFHSQILTQGEWGWIVGSKSKESAEMFKSGVMTKVETKWLDQEAMTMMLSFGKLTVDTTNTKINTIKKPVTFRYYKNGNWSF